MSFQNFLEFNTTDYQKRNYCFCDCIEFWSDKEQEWAYLDDEVRKQCLDNYHAYIRIKADDILSPLNGNHLLTEEEAIRIVNFIKRHDGDDIVVHCNEGISRTGAVVYFLDKYFDYSSGEEWSKKGVSAKYNANLHILRKLEKALGVNQGLINWTNFKKVVLKGWIKGAEK